MIYHSQPPDGRTPPGIEEETAEDAARRAAEFLYNLDRVRLIPTSGGRVNKTWLVDSGAGRFVLQRLNDFFLGDEALGLNWLNVYQSVKERSGVPSPPLPPIFSDMEGRLLSTIPGCAHWWRLTGFIDGQPAPVTPEGAREAARLLGLLHHHLNAPFPLRLLPPPEGEFTNQHLSRPDEFESLHIRYRGHPHLEELKPLIAQAAEKAWQLPFSPAFLDVFSHHDVVIHGDPKADNFLFSPEGKALALLDWDSVGYGHVLVDVAEMLRSWGAARLEDQPEQSADILAAILAGYAETGLPLSQAELAMLPAVLRAIALNLCRRYLTDALAEVYFQWDNFAYHSLYEQNQTRARIMMNLAEMLLDREMYLIDILGEAYQAGFKSGGSG